MLINHPNYNGQILAESSPVILCLHGFMGGQDDWKPVIDLLPDSQKLNVVYLSLPLTFPEGVTDIESYSRWLWQQLPDFKQPVFLLAYSLGARIGMHWLSDIPDLICGALFEGGHPGLPGDIDRLDSDLVWQQRFSQQDLKLTLEQWYQQAVFNGREKDTAEQIYQRHKSDPSVLGNLLITLSVANQQNMTSSLGGHPITYLTGEHDKKYTELAKQLVQQHANIVHHVISGAGHNCHSDQACSVSRILSNFLTGFIHE
ncbi:alpha/beta fold hydrolase [Neptuniibacter sp. PT34_22]|uniref:alpha/beta fold hydrolase n=1 Tax=Neptuniibacter sp. PT34_22 TaxID=3398205 RepID=UPI0039F47883